MQVLFNLANQYHANKMYTEALNTYLLIVKNKMSTNGGMYNVHCVMYILLFIAHNIMYCIHTYNFMLYISIHVHTPVYTYVHAYVHVCMHVHVCTCVDLTHMYTYVHTIQTTVMLYVCTYLNVHMYVCTYACICTQMYTYVCI